MTEQAQHIAALERALAELPPDSPARAGLEAMLAQYRPLSPAQSGGVRVEHSTIDQMGDAVGGDKVQGDKVQGDQINNYFYPPGEEPANLVRRYLAYVLRETQRLTFIDPDSADAEQAPISLDQVYIRLDVGAQVDKDGTPIDRTSREQRRPGDIRQMTALEALHHCGRLVLLGAPGSGKSTFARHLAFCLAQAGCGEGEGIQGLGKEWRRGALTPVWVELRPFADWLITNDQNQSAGELLWLYLGARHTPDLARELRNRVEQDQTVLIFDGLDEIGAGPTLSRIRSAIGELTATRTPRTVLVTCRILDYAEPGRQLSRWPIETLQPFSPTLQEAFITSWFRSLEREGRPLQRSANDLIALLWRAVREKPDLQRLAGNPLLLTMMATLQGAKGELPDKRVELYSECLDQLLRRWRRHQQRPDLESFLAVPTWQRTDTDRLLDHLGYAAAERSSGEQDDDDQTGSAHLTRRQLIDAAEPVFQHYVANPLTFAEKLCEYIERYSSNGVIQQHGPQNFRFPHRTFREFLAARRLISNRDWPEDERVRTARLLRRASSAQWHEALLLAASLLVVQNNGDSVAQLVNALLNEHRRGTAAWAQNVILAGEILTQTERHHLASFGEAGVWDKTVAALQRVLEPARTQRAKPLVDTADRVRAGRALGILGDPRSGVITLEPDWCEVPAGPFLLGSSDQDTQAYDDEKPQRTVDLPAFRVARYPTTNAQWLAFMNAGGYQDRNWWSDAGWQYKAQDNWTQSEYWQDPRFNGSNQPVVGVSWYEAIAFCRWLSVQLGYEVRLPSEAEWEKAARGTDGRIYSWGNTWDGDVVRANTDESSIGTTAPVGCFPDGISPSGVQDMIGNVFEWTATLWTNDYSEHDGTIREQQGGERFVGRGGSWLDIEDSQPPQCTSRYHFPASSCNTYLGLRIVAPLVPSL